MLRDVTFKIVPEDFGKRLDLVLPSHIPSTTRALAVDAFEAGLVFIEGRKAVKSEKAVAGTEVSVSRIYESSDCRIIPGGPAPDVVFHDSILAAADKPAGQNCCPLKPGETGTLAGALAMLFPDIASAGPDPMTGGMLHRIDGGTSGLVLAARTFDAFMDIRAQFAAHTIRKTYYAVVEGKVASAGGVSGFLAHSSSFRGRMRVVTGSKIPRGEKAMFAETFYTPISEDRFGTLIEISIRTGVTHQIRCQLAYAGFPIVGDALYGARSIAKTTEGTTRYLLHSAALEFARPDSGKRIKIRTRMKYSDGDFRPTDLRSTIHTVCSL